eukprot:7031309-Lingulodinium_polyedra.AAC.1
MAGAWRKFLIALGDVPRGAVGATSDVARARAVGRRASAKFTSACACARARTTGRPGFVAGHGDGDPASTMIAERR